LTTGTQSNRRSRTLCVALGLSLLLGPVTSISAQGTFTTDASAPGASFSPGIRGQAIPAVTIDRGEYVTGIPRALEVATGSSLRGVAGGLEADLFDWKTRNNSPRAATLDYLRHSRNRKAELFITANIRGLVEPDPANLGSQRFYDTSIPTLAALAGDWVRYTNRIVQSYRQGGKINDARDRTILDSLRWSSAAPGDSFDKLLSPAEAPVPKVKYWEIGNEPRIGVGAFKVTNSYTFLAPPATPDATHKTDFRERYAALAAAMRAEDPTIRVGPAIQTLSSASEQAVIDTILRQQPDGSFLPVNFLGYHPYQSLQNATTADQIEAALRGTYNGHLARRDNIRGRIAAAGRDPDSIELVASEHNVSNWSSNDTPKEAQMAHALGNTETLFSFARLGVKAAHYWVFPAHRWEGTKYPAFLASEKLRDHMGDTLLSVSAPSSENLHLYSTRDSATGNLALWGLNFDNDATFTHRTPFLNVGGRGRITLHTLEALTGPTSLTSSNLASDMPGGPTHAVDWKSVDTTGARLDELQLSFPAATITLLTIDGWRQLGLPGDANTDGRVDSLDSAIVSANLDRDQRNWWQGDFSGDGLVNSADSSILAVNIGQSTGTRWIGQAGHWKNPANWHAGAVPNGPGASAYFGGAITAASSVFSDSPITFGSLVLDNPNSYVIGGAGSITVQRSGAPARVYVIQGEHKINMPMTLAGDTIIDVAAGATLTIADPVTLADGVTLAHRGSGAVSYGAAVRVPPAASLHLTTHVSLGELALSEYAVSWVGQTETRASASGGAIRLGELSMHPTAKLDLNEHDLIVSHGDFATLRSLVEQGFRAGLAPHATAIVSTAAQRDGGDKVLALIDNALAGAGDWPIGSGQPVAHDAILGKYTFLGDVNLDGRVGEEDLAVISANLGAVPAAGIAWMRGDTDFDGVVTFIDYRRASTNLGKRLPWAATVPEPATMSAMMLGMAAAAARIRSR
jgi:hypothetical protein